jgi:malonate-semialdehyde dehydrogenase (acetylating) / methylmalonate-semialdehyde dehydrogenase
MSSLVAGTWVDSGDSGGEPQYDPSTGASRGFLHYANVADVNAAVAAVAAAGEEWASIDVAERLSVIERVRQLLLDEHHGLAELIAAEVGKPLAVARTEVITAAYVLDSVRDLARSAAPQTKDEWRVRVGISLYHEPLLGPIAMLAPALAAGDVYVWRPCTWSPRTAVALARIFQRAGLPAGVMSMVQGSIDVVDALLDHPLVNDIAYLGSGPWAEYMYTKALRRNASVRAQGALRRIHVVRAARWERSELRAIAGSVWRSVATLAGQRFLAGTFVVVDPPIIEPMHAALIAVGSEFRPAEASRVGTRLGPVVRPERRDELTDLYRTEEALEIVTDAQSGSGFFVAPALAAPLDVSSDLWLEEVAGPVIGLLPVNDADLDGTLASSPYSVVVTTHVREQRQHLDALHSSLPGWFDVRPVGVASLVPMPLAVAGNSFFSSIPDAVFGAPALFPSSATLSRIAPSPISRVSK